MTEGKWSYSMYLKRGDFTLIRLEAEGKKLGILYGLKEENEANARLIAAAPQLLSLLSALCEDKAITRATTAAFNARDKAKQLIAEIIGDNDVH